MSGFSIQRSMNGDNVKREPFLLLKLFDREYLKAHFQIFTDQGYIFASCIRVTFVKTAKPKIRLVIIFSSLVCLILIPGNVRVMVFNTYKTSPGITKKIREN